MAHFTTLPDDSVQLIFDRVPTWRLFTIGRVSRSWRRHQLLNCRRRKTLIILQGFSTSKTVLEKASFNKPFMDHDINQDGSDRDGKSFEHNRIYISTYKSLKVNVIIETFPNLCNLIVSTGIIYANYLRSFTQLITSYSSKLVSLQLYFGDELRSSTQKNSVGNIIGNLINQLNSFTALQHFSFHSGWSVHPAIQAPEFLTRLKEFYFVCDGLAVNIRNWLRKYDQTGRLNQLSRIYLKNFSAKTDRSLPSQFDSIPAIKCFAILPLSISNYHNEINEKYLKRIVANFTSLTTFTYNLGNINSLTKLATILSPLTKLVHIGLIIKIAIPTEPLHPSCTPQFKFIKALDLDFPTNFKDRSLFENFLQSQVSTIVHFFPALQSIRIIPDVRYFHYDFDDEMDGFAQKFFENLKVAYGRRSLRTNYYL